MSVLNIDDSLVLRVARRLAQFRTPGDGAEGHGKSTERLLRDQPEVLAFVLAGTGQLSGPARTVGVFLAEVVFDSFRLAGRRTRALRTQDFVRALRENREMALRIGQAHDRIAERYLRNSNTLRQPALIRYVTGVLLEKDTTCPHAVPRDDLGPLFLILKSVVDVLDVDAAGLPAEAEPDADAVPAAALSSEPA